MAPRLRESKFRTAVANDVRGVVYVEFLLAFMPLFLLFLGICQIALVTSARLVVQHAALRAVRSAIVVLEDSPADYDGAPRGSLSKGHGGSDRATRALFDALGLEASDSPSGQTLNSGPQQGARMGLIRGAAYAPLLALSPRGSLVAGVGAETLGESVPAGLRDRIGSALAYARAASVVTIHGGSGALVSEPVDGRAAVTVRVTYLYPCAVPLVRVLMCRTLATLLGSTATAGGDGAPLFERVKLSEAPDDLLRIAAPTARFIPLTAEATLPNQGAAYYTGDKG